MKKPKMTYFEQEDILHLVISDEEEANSIELTPNVTAELNERGELIGIEILSAYGRNQGKKRKRIEWNHKERKERRDDQQGFVSFL